MMRALFESDRLDSENGQLSCRPQKDTLGRKSIE
jgi:hypothetical protein